MQLTQLTNLRLDSNYLKSIPAWLFRHLPCMQIFNISNNLIQRIPPDIVYWAPSLICLDVSLNRLEDLGPEIGQLSKLNVLVVRQNDFRYLPHQLRNLRQLKQIDLDWFKYLNPPAKSWQEGPEGEAVIQQLFSALRDAEHFAVCGQQPGSETEFSRKGWLHFSQFAAVMSAHPFDVNWVDNVTKRNLLHKAAGAEDMGVLASLLAMSPRLMNQVDQAKISPLALSLLEEKYFSAKLLIAEGADMVMPLSLSAAAAR